MTTSEAAAGAGFKLNTPPAGVSAGADLPKGFLDFFEPLHRRFARRQAELLTERRRALQQSLQGRKPQYLPEGLASRENWRVELPGWCQDQRNQMTGPGDDAELVVKMLNSGAPGVMLDLEDSTVNDWAHQRLASANILSALRGELSYSDGKSGARVGIRPSATSIWVRPRGLHIHQGLSGGEVTSASLFDVALIAYGTDPDAMKHPLAFYVPKSESAREALWWSDVFQAVARARGWPARFIKCMALVESHPLAFQMEEFAYNLRDHLLGLNLGRWDYMASLIHFNLEAPAWVLPDRNTIPHDVAFFQNLRGLLPEICHKHGMLAIGGMTALYPSRVDPELNARALQVLAQDKKNEADSLMDGAWTGHPDQNRIALAQFPAPNQVHARRAGADGRPDLRPVPRDVGRLSLEGTRAAVRTVIRYRNGVLNGKGASLLDGYMEDLATDRIYRLMLAQRLRHRGAEQAPQGLGQLFDEELERLLGESRRDPGTPETFRQARQIAESMILREEFDPI